MQSVSNILKGSIPVHRQVLSSEPHWPCNWEAYTDRASCSHPTDLF